MRVQEPTTIENKGREMVDGPEGTVSSDEIKPSFSMRFVVLTCLIAIIPAAITGVGGYFFNEYMRDKKILEVSSTSSGNLASIPVSAAGSSLEILLPLPSGQKEPIKSLIRYDVGVTNKTEQGIDDFSIFLKPPGNVSLLPGPTLTTIPSALKSAISMKEIGGSGGQQLVINLLNPGQTIKLGYLGFSQTEFIAGNAPLDIVISKKDWAQRNVVDGSAAVTKETSTLLWVSLSTSIVSIITLLIFLVGWLQRIEVEKLREDANVKLSGIEISLREMKGSAPE
jgi:hypothetical protein